MSQEVRRRTTTASSTVTVVEEDKIMRGSGLSAHSMMSSSPSQSGGALKLRIPLLYSMMPRFIQRIISSCCCGCCPSFVRPRWTERFLIQIGGYLYKFADDRSRHPKGTPFAVESIDVRLVDESELKRDTVGIISLPRGYHGIFSVSTLRKEHFYAVPTRDEARTWVNSLREGRQETITRSMGHAANMPYPSSWTHFDNLAKNLRSNKDRIKSRMEETVTREMEMSTFGEGGPIARGYFG